MGVVVKTVTEVTCDLCHEKCSQQDAEISIQVNSGDGRDVGPGFITGRLVVNLPYRVTNGIVCGVCKMAWLSSYVKYQGAA